MKNLTIVNRILLFLGYTGLIIVAVLVFLYNLQLRQEKILFNETHDQFTNTVNSIIKLNLSMLNQVVYDYTFWDEFVEETESVDTAWYENNITTILKSFHADNVCVYNKHSKLLHEASTSDFLLSALITTEILQKLSQVKFLHYYQMVDDQIYEISCATIHAESDPTHTQTPLSGFFFLGKKWSKSYITELETLTGSAFGMAANDSAQHSNNSFIIQASFPLTGWDEKPEIRVIFSKELKSLKQFHLQSLYLSHMVIGSFLLVLGMFYFTFRRLVIKPLNLVTGILKTENPQQIELLKKSKGEFRFIGRLISEFISQKQQLVITKEQAEESNRLKSAFLANMSHEIRTPMNGILGFTELLKEPELSEEQLASYLSVIEKSGARMLTTLNDIIDFSRIEAGITEVFITKTSINGQIEFIYDFFKPEADAKGLTISYKNALPDNEAFINTDQEKLAAILTNLVKNAVKFTHQGFIEFGYVSTGSTTQIDYTVVERGRLSEVETSRNDELIFYVKDTGIGIPENRREAIFERFIQADIGDKRAYQGSGLGLSISKAYVEMLGGKIWVESYEENLSTGQPGSTVFYFTIPGEVFQEINVDIENDYPEKKYKVEPSYQGPKLKILIAEDDQTSDEILTITLRDFSREILHVTTGTEAVEACRQHPDIDLIMMDIKMPGIDGLEATKRIRSFNQKVIIIAQTANALLGDREKAMEAGCNDYFTKPLKKGVLSGIIHEFFDKKK